MTAGAEGRPRLSLTSVRYAARDDLPRLADIERAADRAFASFIDIGQDIGHWPAPLPGEARAALPGFLLAAGHPVVGFAHVVDLRAVGSAGWHLEQIAVHPSGARRGIGTMLLRAALGEALDRGGRELSLMTFADVPWNGPWYAREGFVEVSAEEHPDAWRRLEPLRDVERRLGLAAHGRRVGMVASLADEPPPTPAVSIIPLRSRAGVLEVFVQHRALTMDFAPGAVVFPGGRVDPADRVAANRDGTTVERACAVREVAEETGAVIEPQALIPWDRWITPIGYPRRFDVDFFLLPVAQGGEFSHRTTEATHSEWVSVGDLVRATESGRLSLVPPTRTIVDELSALGTLRDVLALRPTVVAVRHDVTDARPRI